MNPHLFVYGTLMSSAGHPMGARLGREAQILGDASIAGRLYRLGVYPGLVNCDAGGERVHGETLVLSAPATTLRWLDRYEGIGGSEDDEYIRVERTVRLASGEETAAWVYLYRKSVAHLTPIPGGRWVAAPG